MEWLDFPRKSNEYINFTYPNTPPSSIANCTRQTSPIHPINNESYQQQLDEVTTLSLLGLTNNDLVDNSLSIDMGIQSMFYELNSTHKEARMDLKIFHNKPTLFASPPKGTVPAARYVPIKNLSAYNNNESRNNNIKASKPNINPLSLSNNTESNTAHNYCLAKMYLIV